MVVFPRTIKEMKKDGRRENEDRWVYSLSDILTLKITYRKCSQRKDVSPVDLATSRAGRKYEGNGDRSSSEVMAWCIVLVKVS